MVKMEMLFLDVNDMFCVRVRVIVSMQSAKSSPYNVMGET